mgnify:CR=1 FL=1
MAAPIGAIELVGVLAADSGATAQPAGSATELAAVDGAAAAGADDAVASRLKKAVTSVVVVTMPTTLHPCADFSVRVAARAAGSLADALVVENSCMPRTVARTESPLSSGAGHRCSAGTD